MKQQNFYRLFEDEGEYFSKRHAEEILEGRIKEDNGKYFKRDVYKAFAMVHAEKLLGDIWD